MVYYLLYPIISFLLQSETSPGSGFFQIEASINFRIRRGPRYPQ
jgi:hypothetical protein